MGFYDNPDTRAEIEENVGKYYHLWQDILDEIETLKEQADRYEEYYNYWLELADEIGLYDDLK